MIEREVALHDIDTHPIVVEREIQSYRRSQAIPTQPRIKPLGINLKGDERKRYLAIKKTKRKSANKAFFDAHAKPYTRTITTNEDIIRVRGTDWGEKSFKQIAMETELTSYIVRRIIFGETLPEPERCPECGNMVYMPCVKCNILEK